MFLQRASRQRRTPRQLLQKPGGDRVFGRPRDDESRGALQHCHLRRGFGQRRNKRDGGRAAADHEDPLAGAIEVLRPLLRMDDGPRELLHAGPAGHVSTPVVVVSSAHMEEAAAEADGGAVCALDVERP